MVPFDFYFALILSIAITSIVGSCLVCLSYMSYFLSVLFCLSIYLYIYLPLCLNLRGGHRTGFCMRVQKGISRIKEVDSDEKNIQVKERG